MVAAQRFEFRFDPRFVPFLAAMGVIGRTSGVVVDDVRFTARFGLLRVSTPIDNLRDIRVTRDYRWYRAIGARLSFTDHGATFGTNTEAGVCVDFHEPVAALFGDRFPHPGLTVTVADPDALVSALRERLEASAGP
jgi:hypothetical protein